MKPPKTRATNKYIRGGFEKYGIDTTELESYKLVEPRDGGKKLGFAIGTRLSLALEIELEQVRDLCFALLRSWLNREYLLFSNYC